MKKKIFILIATILIIIIFSVITAAESRYNWEELISTTQKQLDQNKNDIVLNYTMAVAYANTGEIKKAYDIIAVSYTHLTLPTIYSV